MKILCIHGIGHQEERTHWRDDWKQTITERVREWDATEKIEIVQFEYDALLEAASTSGLVYLTALTRLMKSWIGHPGERDVFNKVRWTVGMVAQWSALDVLRVKLRAKLADEIRANPPDVIFAHSLGSLVAFDTLRHVDSRDRLGAFRGAFVTLGSQVGHKAVADVFAGRVEMPKLLTRWWNLYNENDVVFTREFNVPPVDGISLFDEVLTPFSDLPLSHDADCYLNHVQARAELWRPLVTERATRGLMPGKGVKVAGATKGSKKSKASAQLATPAAATSVIAAPERPKMRALLVGIAEYANPEYMLQGPVNDVFLVSQTLQEMGVEADAIRVVLNDRATAVGIRERLAWLLNDARDDETLFFYFSGHGAQVPAYGRDAEVDHIDECLVPYDFNWEQGNAIFDDEFAALYSQLPYGATFVAMLDCCHAGGMQRGVGGLKSGGSGMRSINMPDDIRHRALRWDRETQMWLPRERLLDMGLKRKQEMQKFEAKTESKTAAQLKVEGRVGEDGTLRRFGRGQDLRGDNAALYHQRRKEYGHSGPYMPILLEACTENESAYEYQHGSVSYGAFTYALCESLNRGKSSKKPAKSAAITFEALVDTVAQRVKTVAAGPQTPQLVCPEFRRKQPVIKL